MKGRPKLSRRPLSFILKDMEKRLIWEGESAKEIELELDKLRSDYLRYCHLLEMETACVDSMRSIYALVGEHIEWDKLPPNTRQVLHHVLSTPKKWKYSDTSDRMEVVGT